VGAGPFIWFYDSRPEGSSMPAPAFASGFEGAGYYLFAGLFD